MSDKAVTTDLKHTPLMLNIYFPAKSCSMNECASSPINFSSFLL